MASDEIEKLVVEYKIEMLGKDFVVDIEHENDFRDLLVRWKSEPNNRQEVQKLLAILAKFIIKNFIAKPLAEEIILKVMEK